MELDCLGPEDLDALVDGTATAERRAHAEQCRRCRLLLAEYRSFLAAEPAAGADPVAAASRLERAWDDEARRTPVAIRSGRWFSAPRIWGPGLAACAAAVMLLVLLPGEGEDLRGPTGLLREESAAAGVFAVELVRATPAGDLRVGWSAHEGADEYRLQILDAGLAVIHEQDAGGGLEFVLDRGAWPRVAGPCFLRIEALSAGTRIGSTPPREIREAR